MSAKIYGSFIMLLLCVVYNSCAEDYTVPEPMIELLKPKGFSVKIPHCDGMSIFAFHGKINEEMNFLEAGHFSRDIRKRTGNFWIFQDRGTKLNVGDKIHFWLFVIRNGLGYRYDDGMFTVKENTPYRIDEPILETTTMRKPFESTISSDVEVTTKLPNDVSSVTESHTLIKICETAILNITDSLFKLQAEVSSLKDTNEILKEISEKHPASARTLKVGGRIPVNEDALSTVKGIIKQKLALSIEIVDAKRNEDDSITFDVSSLDDKIQIIRTAREKLKYSRIKLTY